MVRTVTEKEAGLLRAQGWKACDLHCHTSVSPDVFPLARHAPGAVYEAAKARGMDFVTFTDHDSMAAHERFKAKDLIVGCEFSIFDEKFVGHSVHVNVYGFSKQQYATLQNLALKGKLVQFVRTCKKFKLPYQLNHPFWADKRETFHVTSIPKIAKLFPVIEVNAKRVRLKNDLALLVARHYKKGVSMGSDSHIGEPGRVYTLAQGKTFKEWYANVASGNAVIVRRDLGIGAMAHEIAHGFEALCSKELSQDQFAPFKARWGSGNKYVDKLVFFFVDSRKTYFGRVLVRLVGKFLAHCRVPAALYVGSEIRSGRQARTLVVPQL